MDARSSEDSKLRKNREYMKKYFEENMKESLNSCGDGPTAIVTSATRDKLSQSSRTRDGLKAIEGEIDERTATSRASTTMHELLLAKEKVLGMSMNGATDSATSLKTRELLAKWIQELEHIKSSPSTSTRDRLKAIEGEIDEQMATSRTSTRTRELLLAKEKELEMLKNGATASATSSKTRELLAKRIQELERIKSSPSTSTRTREKLAQVEASIEREMEKRTSTRTRLAFVERQKMLEGLLKQSSNIDLVFMMDCTGSMCGHINQTKADLTKIVEHCIEIYESQMRVGFVGYRDHCDGSERIETHDLTENHNEVTSFMNGLRATGGGDECEDIFGGLEAVINLTWKHPNRVLIHVGDAPQHGSRFHDSRSDSYITYNEADPRGLKIENLIQKIKQMKISYFFGKINNSTDKMIREFCKVAQDMDFIQEIDLKTPGDIFSVAVMSVSKTVDATVGATLMGSMKTLRFGETTVKEFYIVEEEPELEDVATETVQWLQCNFPSHCDPKNIRANVGNIKHKWTREIIKKAANPFAEGAQRISYHGLRGDEEEEIVLKEFKKLSSSRDCRQDYIQIMETQAVAAFMASEFNKVAPPAAKSILFVEVSVVQVTAADGTPSYFNVEKQLPNYKEKFTKWCNNSGYVNVKQFAASLDAFCHWTFEITGGYLMVVDIQGVAKDNSYILTDPCIHCRDDYFGTTNFGEVGIKSFFKTHTCNKICEQLGLKKNKHQRSKGIMSSLKSVIS